MRHTPNTLGLGLVLGLAVVLVAATPAPNTNGTYVTPTPAPTRATMKPTPTPTATPRPTPTSTGKATPTPTPTPNHEWTPTPPPAKEVLSDTIQFDGPQYCKLTSDASDRDAPNPATGGHGDRGPVTCRMTNKNGLVTVTVPGDPDETISFKYSVTPGTTSATGAARELENGKWYPAKITGTINGVPGTNTGSGVIKVWESSTAP
jgi:hypothetical protein